jgi:cytochrome c-type biogenesis protein
LMLAGRNPFARLAGVRMPVVRQPLGQAYVYGLLFGPVALPCAGPFVVALLAISIGVAETATRMAGFVAFGVGFGLPLIGLSLIGAVRARAITGWLARHQTRLMRIAGALLIVAAFAEPLRLWLEG